MAEEMYCITCGKMVTVCGGLHMMTYVAVEGDYPELTTCEGPFTDAAPTSDELTVLFDLCNGHDPIE